MSVIIAKDQVREPLWCIVPLFNPWRFKARWKHTARAIKHFADSGAIVVLVEVAFNRREFVFADSGLDGTLAECSINGGEFRHKYIGLRTKDELWLKENSINIAAQSLPYNWQQVCWLDGDIQFARPNWVGECIHQLQHVKFLQMFSHARDLDPDYEVLPSDYPHADGRGYVAAWKLGHLDTIRGPRERLADNYYFGRVWPGLAWAATRQGWDEVGGLIDWAVWGGGDYHMAMGLTEQRQGLMREDLHPNYQQLTIQWYERCKRYIRRNIGLMSGTVLHNWHGRKSQRGYNSKHKLLATLGFDPLVHLKRDYSGLWQLNDDGSENYIQLRDTLRRIALERNEDSIDIFGSEDQDNH